MIRSNNIIEKRIIIFGAISMDRHEIETVKFFKTRFCQNYLKGKCQRGEKCNFAHKKQEMRLEDDKYYKTKICDAFVKGRCPHDTLICKYAHGQQDLRNPPPIKRQCSHQERVSQYNGQRLRRFQWKSSDNIQQQNKIQDKPHQSKHHINHSKDGKNYEINRIGNNTPQSTRDNTKTQQMKCNIKKTPQFNVNTPYTNWMSSFPQNRVHYQIPYSKDAKISRQNQFFNFPYENMHQNVPFPQFSNSNNSNQQVYYPDYFPYNPYYNYYQVFTVPHNMMIPSTPNTTSSSPSIANKAGNHPVPIHVQSIKINNNPLKFAQPVSAHQVQPIVDKHTQSESQSKSLSSTFHVKSLSSSSSKNIVNSTDDNSKRQSIKNSPINRLNNYKPKVHSQFYQIATRATEPCRKINSFSSKFHFLKSDMQNKNSEDKKSVC